MTTFIIATSKDHTEMCMTSKENWEGQERLRVDSDEGDPVIVVKEFEAQTYEEAKVVFEDCRDRLRIDELTAEAEKLNLY
jgi:hypothetical protein